MTHLVVLGLDSREDAERVLRLTDELAKQELLQRDDAAIAYKDDRGKVRIQQTMNLTGAGAAGGALWGTLIGLLFLNPLAGLAVGAASGAVAGKLTDIGISDQLIKEVGRELQEGHAAVFLLARSATVDRVVEALKPLGPTVLQSNLSREREEELVQALQA
ncbi:DUF1269 domain-containing protein [Kribbella sp. HUAS MG21]|jgi:uncharacterized membrane protein|uniref:DUF1269 domain-containing protein n=1 Tax=Kribbella sp. HUAS MG21 TaxID=3160966 RepID=A0AAU7T673_9ACTN